MFAHKAKDKIGCAPYKVDHALAMFEPIGRNKIFRIVLQAGDHLSAITSRCTEADMTRFKDHDRLATLGKEQCA